MSGAITRIVLPCLAGAVEGSPELAPPFTDGIRIRRLADRRLVTPLHGADQPGDRAALSRRAKKEAATVAADRPVVACQALDLAAVPRCGSGMRARPGAARMLMLEPKPRGNQWKGAEGSQPQ